MQQNVRTKLRNCLKQMMLWKGSADIWNSTTVKKISIADLSEEFFLAPNYIAKRFKEKKKVTILQYLENIRIGKAREYLKMTEYSVSEIAALVGYNDANYFTRAFRKVCDMSPREFRKQEHFE